MPIPFPILMMEKKDRKEAELGRKLTPEEMRVVAMEARAEAGFPQRPTQPAKESE